ncbi:MAG: glycosyltransferase family 2 protein [Bacteroidota bacterium]
MIEKCDISVVVPVYGCSTSIRELYLRLISTLSGIVNEFEIIFVNDSSPDDAWVVITDICNRDARVVGIDLSRNFGQHNAIMAGLGYVRGEWVVVMDCDLQDKPEEIKKLYNESLKGYDVVYGKRFHRKDTFVKRMNSKLFYKVFSYLTDTKQDYTIANFGIYNSKVISAVLSMGDVFCFFPVLVNWVGFKKTAIDIEHLARANDKSSYTFGKLFNLALDVIISFSEKPIKVGLKIGIFMAIISFLVGFVYFVLYVFQVVTVPGFTSLIIAISFSTGMILTFLGLLGLYIGKISTQVKLRPKFIVNHVIMGNAHE